MPPTDAVYPLRGDIVTVVCVLLFTCCVAGLTEPFVPADAVTVHFCILAEQLAAEPPLDPVQLHVQGPLPLTAVAVPALQRLVVGAEVNVPPLDEPHAPLIGVAVAIFTVKFAAAEVLTLPAVSYALEVQACVPLLAEEITHE